MKRFCFTLMMALGWHMATDPLPWWQSGVSFALFMAGFEFWLKEAVE